MPPEFRGVQFPCDYGDIKVVGDRRESGPTISVCVDDGDGACAANLDRDQVEELHRRLGHWLAAQPKAPAKWEDL